MKIGWSKYLTKQPQDILTRFDLRQFIGNMTSEDQEEPDDQIEIDDIKERYVMVYVNISDTKSSSPNIYHIYTTDYLSFNPTLDEAEELNLQLTGKIDIPKLIDDRKYGLN